MAENTPGPSKSVKLVSNSSSSKLNLSLCLICQRVKDVSGSKKLTSTKDGRQNIIDTSKKIKDGLVASIEPHDPVKIHYHLKSCYSTYRKKGERFTKPTSEKLTTRSLKFLH